MKPLRHSHPLGLLRRCAVWLVRFRHRCGYGIHSPFAFHIVRDVIYEKEAYYAYASLAAARHDDGCGLREKDCRLLLRLANDHGPRRGLVAGSNAETVLPYLRAGRTSCDFRRVDDESSAALADELETLGQVDFCYADTAATWQRLATDVLPRCHGGTLLVVRGIHRDRAARRVWKELRARPAVRVTFDLYDFGLAYFEERLNKQDYVINYF